MNDLEKVQRISCYGLATMDDKVLLVQIGPRWQQDADSWMLPGGGVEHGEQPEAAVVREIVEETGLVVSVDRLLEVGSDHRTIDDSVDFHCVYLVYRVSVTGGELRDEANGITAAPTWMPIAALDSLPILAMSRHSLRLVFGQHMTR
jgi:8-oxo-dGTP diphosphatase